MLNVSLQCHRIALKMLPIAGSCTPLSQLRFLQNFSSLCVSENAENALQPVTPVMGNGIFQVCNPTAHSLSYPLQLGWCRCRCLQVIVQRFSAFRHHQNRDDLPHLWQLSKLGTTDGIHAKQAGGSCCGIRSSRMLWRKTQSIRCCKSTSRNFTNVLRTTIESRQVCKLSSQKGKKQKRATVAIRVCFLFLFFYYSDILLEDQKERMFCMGRNSSHQGGWKASFDWVRKL